MGRPHEGNPIECSRKQMYALNVLTRNSDTPSNNGSTGDNWRDGSILAAAQGGSTAGQKRGHMNMLRVNTETDDEGDAIPPFIDNATGIPIPRTPDAAPSTPVRAPRHIDTSTQTSMSSQTFTHLLHQLSGYQVYVTLHLEHSNLP